MPRIPGVTDFVPFSEVDPLSENRCIYHLPDKGRRCLLKPISEDRSAADTLKRTILQYSNTEIPLASLQTYALLNCCRKWHQARLDEFNIVEPLARRWQEELRAKQILSVTRGQYDKSGVPPPSPLVLGSVTPSQTEVSTLPRYNTRSSGATGATETAALAAPHDVHKSEFRPHKIWPPQTVSSILLGDIEGDDRKPGLLYLYTRAMSPGFVKIGFTRRSAKVRLDEWQRDCGYVPILVGSFSGIPNPKRVETLMHFECYKEWRKEVWCRRCAKQHMEWFEIATDKAVNIAGQWAEWMKEAKPYSCNGILDTFWRAEVQNLEACGETVTAAALLDIHKANKKAASTTAARLSTVSVTITATSVASVDTDPAATSSLEQVEETTTPTVQPPATGIVTTLTSTKLVADRRHVKVIAEAVLALTEQQQAELAVELVRRTSTMDSNSVSRAPTLTFKPERLERQNTSTALAACA